MAVDKAFYLQKLTRTDYTEFSLSKSVMDLTRADFLEVLEALAASPAVEKISLKDVTLKGDEASALAQAIRQLPIRSLLIENCQIGGQDIAELMDACANKPSLAVLRLQRTPLGSEAAARLGDLLPNSHIRYLNLNNCDLGQFGLSEIARGVAGSRKLTKIITMNNPATNELGNSYYDVLTALEKNPSIVEWQLRHSPYESQSPAVKNSEFDATVLEAEKRLLDAAPVNLFRFDPYTNPASRFGRLTDDNWSRAQALAEEIKSRKAEDLTLRERVDIELQWPLISEIGSSWARGHKMDFRAYDRFRHSLPVLPFGEAVTLDNILKANDAGYCSLDNPRTWLDTPDILKEALDNASVEEKDACLTRETAKGKTLPAYILEVQGVRAVVDTLIERGIQLRSQHLVNADHEPSSLLQAAIEANEVAAFFTPENWKGAHPAELRYVYEALPEEAKSQVANIHGLQCELQREARQSQKHTAGRM